MNTRELLRLLRMGWVTIAVSGVVALALGLGYGLLVPPTYESTNAMRLVVEPAADMAAGESPRTTQQVMVSVLALAESSVVSDEIADALQPEIDDDGRGVAVAITSHPNTDVVAVTAHGVDAVAVARAANATSDILRREFKFAIASTDAKLIVVQRVEVPFESKWPSPALPAIAALVVGLAVGSSVVVLMPALRRTRRSNTEV